MLRKDGTEIPVEITGKLLLNKMGLPIGIQGTTRDITERKQLEAELLVKNEVFEASITANSTSDNEGILTYVNSAFIKIFGYENKEEAVGKPISDFLKFEDEAMNIITALNETGVWEGEYTGLRKDGTTFAAYGLATIIKDRSGDSIGYQSAVLDISDRKRMEEILRESEEKYSSVVENSVDGIIVLQKGIIKFLNQAILDLTGYNLEELIDNEFETLLSPEYRKLVMDRYQARLARKDVPSMYEMEIIRKDGISVPIEVSNTIMTYEGEEATLSFIRDITERKQAEEALREGEEKYRQLVNYAPSAILELDIVNNKFITVNEVACEYTGYTKEELLSINLFDLLTEDSKRLFMERVSKMSEGKQIPESVEYKIAMKNGQEIFCMINSRITFDEDGKPIRSTIVAHDITDLRQVEEEKEKMRAQLLQAQKMEAIGILAGGVAHDFNNILTAILGYTDLAMMKMDEADLLYRDLKQIDLSATRAASLTRQLLLFSRRQPMEFTSFNLNTTVDNLLKMLNRLIGEDIAIKTELDSELWTVQTDSGNIEKVILNITVNARDAMSEGGTLTIKTENMHADEDYCKTYTYAHPGRFV